MGYWFHKVVLIILAIFCVHTSISVNDYHAVFIPRIFCTPILLWELSTGYSINYMITISMLQTNKGIKCQGVIIYNLVHAS